MQAFVKRQQLVHGSFTSHPFETLSAQLKPILDQNNEEIL
jgi:hypothetical protein